MNIFFLNFQTTLSQEPLQEQPQSHPPFPPTSPFSLHRCSAAIVFHSTSQDTSNSSSFLHVILIVAWLGFGTVLGSEGTPRERHSLNYLVFLQGAPTRYK